MRTALSRSITRTLFTPALALAGAVMALSPTQAMAGSAAGYSVKLVAPLAAPKQAIINDALWKCSGDSCVSGGEGSRPVLVCQQVARKFGEVAAFTAGSTALATEDLAKCNKR